MLKNLVIALLLMGFITPVFAEEINMTPHATFSGTFNTTHPA